MLSLEVRKRVFAFTSTTTRLFFSKFSLTLLSSCSLRIFLLQCYYKCNNYSDHIYDHSDNRVCIQNNTSSFFLFFYFIEELIRILCTPSTAVFHIPLRGLHFPVWDIIFHCERRYVPYTSVVWLCCKIAVF